MSKKKKKRSSTSYQQGKQVLYPSQFKFSITFMNIKRGLGFFLFTKYTISPKFRLQTSSRRLSSQGRGSRLFSQEPTKETKKKSCLFCS